MDLAHTNAIRFIIMFSIPFLFFLIWLGIALFLRIKKKQNLTYLLFFTLFYTYLYKVLDYTLFQFQSLILLKQFLPNLMLNGLTAGESVNLIPLATLTATDLKTSLLNILLMIPFGFGLPFITRLSGKKIVILGAVFSIAIELLQFMSGYLTKITFRIADINDVIFNTLGVAVGYILFVEFMKIFRQIFHDRKISTHTLLHSILKLADR